MNRVPEQRTLRYLTCLSKQFLGDSLETTGSLIHDLNAEPTNFLGSIEANPKFNMQQDVSLNPRKFADKEKTGI